MAPARPRRAALAAGVDSSNGGGRRRVVPAPPTGRLLVLVSMRAAEAQASLLGCRIHPRAGSMRRIRHLRQLVRDAQYVVDEEVVADAIIARARARRLVAGVVFRNDRSDVPVRSFRPSAHARSFRPSMRRDVVVGACR
jgi:hypothetical protein